MSATLSVTPVHLTVEHYPGDVLGIGQTVPRLSWQYSDVVPADAKTELEITRRMPAAQAVVQSVPVGRADNVLLPWPLTPLNAREQVIVRARLTQADAVSEWSAPLHFELGLTVAFEREAAFVGPAQLDGHTDHRPQPLVRTEFVVPAKPVQARLYLSALGLVDAELNGQRVGQDILTPGWTQYDDRLELWTYDITQQLQAGTNALGFWLGDGWYRGRVGFKGGQANVYGDRLGVFAQVEIFYADGSEQQIFSNSYDRQWYTVNGPITASNLFEGEDYDARLTQPGWTMPGFDDSGWDTVAQIPFDNRKLELPILPPVRAHGQHPAVTITKTGEHKGRTNWIVDFGQNCTQRVRLHIHDLAAGDQVSIQHAEVLEKDGSLSTRPLRRGQQLDTYISNGEDALWEPRFTIHGFRYAEVKGWPGELTAADMECIVYYSAMKQVGQFASSNQLVNRLHDNVLWSMRSNFVSIPTDCPQRDERLGWTGDISLFASTADYLYDTSSFLSNWLVDVRSDQKKWGTVPFYVPFIPFAEWSSPQAIAIWGDAAVMVPWTLYMNSGDKQQLASQYALAQAWIDEVHGYLSPDGVWDRKPHYSLGQLGDWLDPTAPPDDPVKAMTQKELVATAFFARSVRLFVKMAQALDRPEEAERYERLAQHIERGFQHRFVHADGRMTSDTQCAYALAIVFNLLTDQPELQTKAGNRLAALVQASHGQVSTGFAGMPYVLPALTQTGHLQEAYSLFLSDKCPSWLYQVKMGGTTTWERWDSMLPDGSVNPGVMTSFNHYSLGSVAAWMHSTIGGLTATAPGWRTFRVAPQPGGGITQGQTSRETPYGLAAVTWQLLAGEFRITVTVPNGTTATVVLPDGTASKTVTAGQYTWSEPVAENAK